MLLAGVLDAELSQSLGVIGRDWDVNEGRRDSDAGGENEERREEHLFFFCWEQKGNKVR